MQKLMLCTLALLAGIVAGAETIEEKTCKAGPRPRVAVANVAGAVVVEGWDKQEVRVHARLGERVERLDFRCVDDRVHIQVVAPKNANNGIKSYLTVFVPFETGLEVSAVSAEISVKAVAGALDLQSVSGDIEVVGDCLSINARSVSGDIELQAGSGEVEASTASGDIAHQGDAEELDVRTVSGDAELSGHYEAAELSTTSGDMQLSGSVGELNAQTVSGDLVLGKVLREGELSSVSGDLKVTGDTPAELEMYAVSGEVQYAGELADNARVRIETTSGNVTMGLGGAHEAAFDVETTSGSIRNELTAAEPRPRRKGAGAELVHGGVSGAPSIEIETRSGSVSLLRTM